MNSLLFQIVQLSLHELPSSSKAEIHSTIIRMMENYKTERRMCPALVKKLRRCILHEELAQRRRDQLSLLFCLEKEINLVSKSVKKIEVENFVDLEILPFNFSYLNANVPGVDVSFPKSPPIGCDCIGKRICLLNNCCPEMFNSQPTYNEFGEVLVSQISDSLFNFLSHYCVILMTSLSSLYLFRLLCTLKQR